MIEGAGPAFSAGHDLGEMVGRDAEFYERLFDVCTVLMETIHRVPQPVIAKVHGIATAAGCQLVAACDLAVAANGTALRDARREDRPVLLDADGAALARGRPQARARAAAHRRADRRGDGARLGTVNRVVPADELEGRRARPGDEVARSSPLTVRIGKRGVLPADRARRARRLRADARA